MASWQHAFVGDNGDELFLPRSKLGNKLYRENSSVRTLVVGNFVRSSTLQKHFLRSEMHRFAAHVLAWYPERVAHFSELFLELSHDLDPNFYSFSRNPVA